MISFWIEKPGQAGPKASIKQIIVQTLASRRNMSSSPRRSPRHQKLQVNLSGREQKKKAPTPCKKSVSPQKYSVQDSRYSNSLTLPPLHILKAHSNVVWRQARPILQKYTTYLEILNKHLYVSLQTFEVGGPGCAWCASRAGPAT